MRAMLRLIVGATTLAVAALPAVAQTPAPIVYPAKGQSTEQQAKDKTECDTWAKQNTGIDPAAVAATPPPAAPAADESNKGPKGERLRGAARGAAAGAVVGEIADDDASEGAKIGAAAGVVAGGRQSRKNEAQAQQQAQQSAADAQKQADAEK